MAWVTKVALSSLSDVSAAALVSQPTQTRAAVDARARIGAAQAVTDALADDDTVKDAAAAALQDAAVQEMLYFYKSAQPLTAESDLPTLPDGIHRVAAGSTATAIGLPTPSTGMLMKLSQGTAGVQVWFANRGLGDPEIWMRNQTSGGWRPWVKVTTSPTELDSVRYYRGIVTSVPNRDDLPSGTSMLTSVAAGDIGIPDPAAGSLHNIINSAKNLGTQMFVVAGINPRVYVSARVSTGWQPWRELGGNTGTASSHDAVPGMRTVPLSLTLGNAGSTEYPAQRAVRLPVRFNAPITRWRARFRNVNPRSGTYKAGVFNLTGLWVGDHTGGGDIANAVQVHGAATIPDQGEWVSPWVTAPLGGDQDRLVAFGYTSSGGVPYSLVGGAYVNSDPGTAAAPGASMSRQTQAPFSIMIEAETYAHTPVIGAAGDSLTCGVGSTLPVHDSTISIYARAVSALPVHYASSGDTMAGSVDPDHYEWQQFDGFGGRPDSILWAMGSNDIFGGASLADMQSRHAEYGAVLASFTPNLYGATIMPRMAPESAEDAVRRAYNTWLLTQPDGIRDVFDFAAAVDSGSNTIRPEFNADNVHLTTEGYEATAAAITRRIAPPVVMYAN